MKNEHTQDCYINLISLYGLFLLFQTTEQAFRHIQNIVDYSQNVMKPLLGEKFVHNGVRYIYIYFCANHIVVDRMLPFLQYVM